MSGRRLKAFAAVAFFVLVGAGWPVAGQKSGEALRSASGFLSPEMAAEQADEMRNRGMLWVDQGLALWQTPVGPESKSCASCHGKPEAMAGVAAHYPQVDAIGGVLLNLEGRVNACRTRHQGTKPLAYETNDLLGLTAMLARQSLGTALTVSVDGAARPYFEQGQALWQARQGQMNLSCAQCHDGHVGQRLRGDTISSAVPVGYPVYRLEWQGMGSLHRRLKACQLGVRALQFPQGAPEYLALELYLAWRANGLPIETPALRR